MKKYFRRTEREERREQTSKQGLHRMHSYMLQVTLAVVSSVSVHTFGPFTNFSAFKGVLLTGFSLPVSFRLVSSPSFFFMLLSSHLYTLLLCIRFINRTLKPRCLLRLNSFPALYIGLSRAQSNVSCSYLLMITSFVCRSATLILFQ